MTLSFTTDERVDGVEVTINGSSYSAMDMGSGTSWEAEHRVSSGGDAETVQFEITSFNDPSGNELTATETRTSDDNMKSVRVDTTAPVVTEATIISNNADTDYGKHDDTVTLTFTTDESVRDLAASDLVIEGLANLSVRSLNDEKTQWEATGVVEKDLVEASQSGGGGGGSTAAFSITVLDNAGNRGSPRDNTSDDSLVLLDVKVPEIVGAPTLTTSNSNSSRARYGDTLTLKFNFSEAVASPTVTLAGDSDTRQLSSNTEKTEWTAVYTVKEDEEEREATYSISYQDAAGNAGAALVDVAPASPIRIDTTTPTLSQVGLSSSNSDTTLAKSGETITLSFTSSESLSNPVVSIAGQTQTLYGEGTSWSANYTVQAGDDAVTSPQDIESLVLWVDATNIDGFLNSTLEDGDQISLWKDLSGNGNDLLQNNLDNQPEFNERIVNDFSGVD
ncbi:MAG: Ig-like domain-containing protein, partial [SAR324 cluster bacterium]|nr:Ig-like domain-containing protein [SAR324 cluster bacterium]